jgi:hypothetical protein
MKRILLGSFLAGLVSVSALAQQAAAPAAQTPQTAQTAINDVTLVGCVTQGSSPTVFLFENAVDPADKNSKPRSFRLMAKVADVDLTEHVNHKVELKGTAEAKVPPATATGKVAEKDLPVFTAKSATHVATTCSPVGQ